jgi:hypothetical protein
VFGVGREVFCCCSLLAVARFFEVWRVALFVGF